MNQDNNLVEPNEKNRIFFMLEIRQRGRFAGFSLYVSNTGALENSSLCYKNGPELPALNFTTICLSAGRYVIFYNERRIDVTYPAGYENHVYTELCEVVVHGKNNKEYIFFLY